MPRMAFNPYMQTKIINERFEYWEVGMDGVRQKRYGVNHTMEILNVGVGIFLSATKVFDYPKDYIIFSIKYHGC